ncbi:MAG TPA: hypothetical protein VNL91_01380 [Thermoanaerobaculia bacterium]|nr:hypothetical protein [Thermoanaerobaculia bacterium]
MRRGAGRHPLNYGLRGIGVAQRRDARDRLAARELNVVAVIRPHRPHGVPAEAARRLVNRSNCCSINDEAL